MKIFLKTEDEIRLMREANQLVGATLSEVGKHIRPGVTTLQLDEIAEEFICKHGAKPTFKGVPNPFGIDAPFPGSICTSVNDVVVHGIPGNRMVLKEGDIVSVDCGALLNGYNGDSCYTFCVGEVNLEVRKLLETTKAALYKGIEQAVAGNHVGDISNAVQQCCEAEGYSVVRELTGHGIGRQMHEDPPVPNYGKCGNGILLKAGMCIAIEPMVAMGDRKIALLPDHWGIVTQDHLPAAHFEHTIVIRRGETEILSTFDGIEQVDS